MKVRIQNIENLLKTQERKGYKKIKASDDMTGMRIDVNCVLIRKSAW